MSDIRKYILEKPLHLIALATAIHSIIFGLGFALLTDDVKIGVIWLYLGQDARWFGVAMVIAGIVTLAGVVKEKNKLITIGSDTQGVGWLFAFIIYLLGGNAFFGVSLALFWAGASGYTAFLLTQDAQVVKNNDKDGDYVGR